MAVMADWSVVYLVLNSRMGTKNFCMYSMNATSVPSATSPRPTWPAPYHNINAMQMALMASTRENRLAS